MVRELFIFAFASAMRIGEICSLDKNNDIDIKKEKIIVHTTLTKNSNGKSIIGDSTKTGRKIRKRGETVVMLYEAKYIDKNRVISRLGKTSNQFFNKIYNKLFE